MTMITLPPALESGLRRFGGESAAAGITPRRLLAVAAGIGADLLARDPVAASFIGGVVAELREHLGAEPDDAGADLLLELGRHLAAALGGSATRRADLERAARDWLDLARRPAVARAWSAAGQVDEAFATILELIRRARFNLGRLWEQRVETGGARTLFRVPSRRAVGRDRVSWLDAAAEVERITRGLVALRGDAPEPPVAILSANSLEMALADLACLTAGIVDLMLPTSLPDADLRYLLDRTGASCVLFSGDAFERKLWELRGDLPALEHLVRLDAPPSRDHVLGLRDLVAAGASVPRRVVAAMRDRPAADDLASIMVTSGTTGRPKGIRFTVQNLVSKRFARGLALPEIGERDVLLAYLPLFHTFGRFLEMLASIHWGAQYVFLEDPSLDGMLERFRRFEPTVFISVPLKWLQLYEEIARRVDVEAAPDEEIREATRAVVGERLRWGLSAAGYLDPEVFRFFQRQGIELLSGFGMTEATGGITMTPPGDYRDDSLGVPLPGIEVRLAEDGEMLIRGPYVTPGYIEAEDQRAAFEDGWLHTGDLMEQSPDGHFRILDRKKEIYKNVKGQTIAPQRIEKLFNDFDAVHRAFLVGDHREYNTLLIVPNLDARDVPLRTMSEEQRREHFRSIVVSVNAFLAPYERIVDFAVLDRDFDPERGELTPKGTFRRRAVVENFAPLIESFYRQVPLRLPGRDVDVKLPNRLFQALGVTTRDVRFDNGDLVIEPTGARLPLRAAGSDAEDDLVQVGSVLYRVRGRTIDLGQFLTCPALWLGNDRLYRLAPMETASRLRRRRVPAGTERLGYAEAEAVTADDVERLRRVAGRGAPGIEDLHRAASALHSGDEEAARVAIEVLSSPALASDALANELAHFALRTAASAADPLVRRAAFAALLPLEEDARVADTIERFLGGEHEGLDEETIGRLARQTLTPAALLALVRFAERLIGDGGPVARERALAIVRLLGRYGAEHPASYRSLRRELTRVGLFCSDREICEAIGTAREALTAGFRRWLGPPQWIAVDPDTGREYGWADVLTFDDRIGQRERERLLEAFEKTSILREALFLIGGGQQVRLSDVPPQGVWITPRRFEHESTTYRVSVHTRWQGSFDVAVGLARERLGEELAEELDWAVAIGEAAGRPRLVEELAGVWPEFGIWAKEFVGGETAERALVRLDRRREDDGVDRQVPAWPFIVWSAAEAYLEFWSRTGRRWVLDDLSPANVIVPPHDYQVGARIVSVASRQPSRGLADYLERFHERFVEPVERRYGNLAGVAQPRLVFSALLEVLGVEDGLAALDGLRDGSGPLAAAAREFVDEVRSRGFVPRRLHFAIERYRRWSRLAERATPAAKIQTLQDIDRTYNLSRLGREFPEARVRFFRETVFADRSEPWVAELDRLIEDLRHGRLDADELVERLGMLARRDDVGEEERFLLARLSFPHLDAGASADFVLSDWGGLRQADVVVTLRDSMGRPFRIRQPVSPKEIGRLHRLFVASRMEVTFSPEHQFLVALNERGHLIGGLYWEVDEDGSRAHLEKIVVDERYRRLGIADGLMNELFSRLRSQGVRLVTTGFYRPSYFYRHGFHVERRYAGLVKDLETDEAEDAG
ncbi:MAG: hypothetical protein Kow0062_12960 [Acidobacteriota bacterium]